MQLDIELGKHIIVKDTVFENVSSGSSLSSVLNLLMVLSLGMHLSRFIQWIACAWLWSFLVILEPRLERAFLDSSPKGMVSFLCLLFVLNLGLHKGAQTWSSVLKGNTLSKRIVYSCRALVIGHLGFIKSDRITAPSRTIEDTSDTELVKAYPLIKRYLSLPLSLSWVILEFASS